MLNPYSSYSNAGHSSLCPSWYGRSFSFPLVCWGLYCSSSSHPLEGAVELRFLINVLICCHSAVTLRTTGYVLGRDRGDSGRDRADPVQKGGRAALQADLQMCGQPPLPGVVTMAALLLLTTSL